MIDNLMRTVHGVREERQIDSIVLFGGRSFYDREVFLLDGAAGELFL